MLTRRHKVGDDGMVFIVMAQEYGVSQISSKMGEFGSFSSQYHDMMLTMRSGGLRTGISGLR